MAGFTDYLENALLNHIFEGTAYTQPTVWVGLFTAAPTDASSGTEVVGGVGYTRIAAPSWTAASSGYTYNSAAVTFPTATGAGWGTVTYFGVCSSSGGGSILAYSSLTTSKTIAAGDSASFSTGAIVITLD